MIAPSQARKRATCPAAADRHPVTGQPLPINLSTQIAGYLADSQTATGAGSTTALINIGRRLRCIPAVQPGQDVPGDSDLRPNVVGSIDQAITTLTNAGVEHIILFTLPDFGTTPNAQAAGPQVVAFVH